MGSTFHRFSKCQVTHTPTPLAATPVCPVCIWRGCYLSRFFLSNRATPSNFRGRIDGEGSVKQLPAYEGVLTKVKSILKLGTDMATTATRYKVLVYLIALVVLFLSFYSIKTYRYHSSFLIQWNKEHDKDGNQQIDLHEVTNWLRRFNNGSFVRPDNTSVFDCIFEAVEQDGDKKLNMKELANFFDAVQLLVGFSNMTIDDELTKLSGDANGEFILLIAVVVLGLAIVFALYREAFGAA